MQMKIASESDKDKAITESVLFDLMRGSAVAVAMAYHSLQHDVDQQQARHNQSIAEIQCQCSRWQDSERETDVDGSSAYTLAIINDVLDKQAVDQLRTESTRPAFPI